MSNLSGLNLGAPIGTHTGNTQAAVSEAGEHGAGVGVSGGHSSVNAHNSQSGALGHSSGLTGNSSSNSGGFNAGLGGEHASAGIPRDNNNHSSSHPIADKFTSGSGVLPSHGSSGDAVSGAYAGGQTGNALTGESHAHTTGQGVGILGENTRSDRDHSSSLQPSGGAGGDYNSPAGTNRETALAPGTGSGSHSHSGAAATGAGLAGIGAGAGAGAAAHHSGHSEHGSSSHGISDSPLVGEDGAKGKYGTVDHDSSRGQPLSNPKELDSGGRHGLVFQESTGTYVHRHELEDAKGVSSKKH